MMKIGLESGGIKRKVTSRQSSPSITFSATRETDSIICGCVMEAMKQTTCPTMRYSVMLGMAHFEKRRSN